MKILEQLRKNILSPVKAAILNRRRRWIFETAVEQLIEMDLLSELPESILLSLIYGWGNESWSASCEYLQGIVNEARRSGGPVLECGSGLSTIVLGVLAEKWGFRIWSLEHVPAWAQKVRQVLQKHHLQQVTIVGRNVEDDINLVLTGNLVYAI